MFDEGDEALVMGHRPGEHGSRAVNALLSTIVRTMTEMEQGLRPVAALDTIASPLAARRIRHQVHEMQLGKRTGKRGGRPRTTPATVLNASSFHPTAGVTEGVVVIESDGRSRAYCIRLEQEATRWRLVELATPGGTLRAAVTEASRSGAVPARRARDATLVRTRRHQLLDGALATQGPRARGRAGSARPHTQRCAARFAARAGAPLCAGRGTRGARPMRGRSRRTDRRAVSAMRQAARRASGRSVAALELLTAAAVARVVAADAVVRDVGARRRSRPDARSGRRRALTEPGPARCGSRPSDGGPRAAGRLQPQRRRHRRNGLASARRSRRARPHARSGGASRR